MPAEVPARRLFAALLIAASSVFCAKPAVAQEDGYVLFFDEFLTGDYYFAALPDVDSANPPFIYPRKLRLPKKFRRKVEIGNADVSPDGSTIVFAARRKDDYDWDIYSGQIHLSRKRIRNVRLLIRDAGAREEDPRFSWDGGSIVYKCGGNICVYPQVHRNPVVVSWCELWGPSFAPSGYAVAYAKRCGGVDSDRIWQYDLVTGAETVVPNVGGGADRYAYFLDDGRLVYSHMDANVGSSSLWVHNTGFVSLLYDRTGSDDDPYPDKHDRNHIAFIGWNDIDGVYDLYVYRRATQDSVRLSQGRMVLAPVLFR